MREQKDSSASRESREPKETPPPPREPKDTKEGPMIELDDSIKQVEQLYRSVTGAEPPSGERPYSPIPPEKDPNRHVEEQMDRLLQALGQPRTMPMQGTPWVPPVTVFESPRETVILVELAGVPRDAVEVSVTPGLLTVAGQRPIPPLDGSEYRLRIAERPLGPFRRVMALPPSAQVNELGAQMRDGLLEIRIPRAAQKSSSVQTIPVK